MIKINSPAPVFETVALHNNNFKKIKLEDYRGKWVVLFFYPADFTFVCPTELNELANRYEEFQKMGVEILSISTDTEYTHLAWHENSETIKKIKFPMLSDKTGKISKMYGVYVYEEGLALRGTFIIDPNGILKAYEVHNNDIGRSVDELIRKIKAAQFVRKNPDQVCPANWHEGQKTLKPGIDLVGKI